MSRSVTWRRVVSDACSWHQDEALNATIYILREIGPTGFLLKEEGENKNFKVLLGDPHTCTCSVFRKEKDLCKHLCWVLLKKFRVDRTNAVCWQLGLVEREITALLKGITAQQQNNSVRARRLAKQAQEAEDEADQDGGVKQREITADDVCPICQEELLEKRLPVTYCKNGCGNNIHIKCMKVWAEHQKSQGAPLIKCPMCREDFGPFSLLQQEFRNSSVSETRAAALGEHLGTTCRKCHACPISGKCYRCSVCPEFHLCQACFNTPAHSQHAFEFRQKSNQRWRPAQRGQGQALPEAVVQNLMARDITEQDYDLLLQLDGQQTQPLSDLTEETVRSFPLERVRTGGALLQPGQQCRVCLRPYQDGQYARRLPCRHKFHKDCIDNWLLHQHATCPIDGTVFTNQSVRLMQQANRIRQQQAASNSGSAPHGRLHPSNTGSEPDLRIPGIGIARLGNSQVLDRHMNGVLEVSGINSVQDSSTQQQQQQRRTRTPVELPESYVYTTSGDYIRFPAQNPTDIRFIQAAAVRSQSGDPFDDSRRNSDSALRSGNGNGVTRTLSFEQPTSLPPIAMYGLENNLGNVNPTRVNGNADSRNVSSGRSDTYTQSAPREERHGLDFSNLLRADVQRNVRHQANSPSDRISQNQNDRRTNQNTTNSSQSSQRRQNSGDSQNRLQNGSRSSPSSQLSPSINLTIGSITDEADAMQRASRGRLHPGAGAAGRAAILRRHQAIENAGDGVERGVHTMDISGQSYQHTNGSTQAVEEDHSGSAVIRPTAPVAPSIPLARGNTVDLAVDPTPAANKPPSGADGASRARGGRLRSKPLYQNPRRPRSTSRDRAVSMERPRAQGDLYVGNDPSSISGFTSDFILANEQALNNHVTSRIKRGRSQGGSSGQLDGRYQWGATQNLTANEMMLSGNAYNN